MFLGAISSALSIGKQIFGGGGGGVSQSARETGQGIQQASRDNSFISQMTRQADMENTKEHSLTATLTKLNETRRNSLDTALNAMSGTAKGVEQDSKQAWS